MTDKSPAIPSDLEEYDEGDGEITLEIDISNWEIDEERGKIVDTRTGLDLLVDGQPNPEIGRRLGIDNDLF